MAEAQTPPPGMVTCARLSEAAERLRCYDNQMSAMGIVVASPAPVSGRPPAPAVAQVTAPPPTGVPVPPAVVSPPPPPPESPEARFGADDLKQTARPKEVKTDKVLLSTITSIKQIRPKLWIIGLANGQIWMQEGTQITSFFKVGFDARIEKGLLGDYRMSTSQTGEKNVVRVTRAQ